MPLIHLSLRHTAAESHVGPARAPHRIRVPAFMPDSGPRMPTVRVERQAMRVCTSFNTYCSIGHVACCGMSYPVVSAVPFSDFSSVRAHLGEHHDEPIMVFSGWPKMRPQTCCCACNCQIFDRILQGAKVNKLIIAAF